MKTGSVKRGLGLAAIGAAALVAISILLLYTTSLSYFYCLPREKSWLKSTNRNELEGRLLAFYSKKCIEPTASVWGRDHALKPGQRMTQYLIFGKEPLDVVYFDDGSVDTIYTSYE